MSTSSQQGPQSGSQQEEYTSFESLPNEMKMEIFSHMNPLELHKIIPVSHQWLSLASDDSLWKKRFIKEFQETQKVDPALSWYENYKLEHTSRRELGEYLSNFIRQYNLNYLIAQPLFHEWVEDILTFGPKFKIWDELSWTENLNNVRKYHLIKIHYTMEPEDFYYVAIPLFVNREIINKDNFIRLDPESDYEILSQVYDIPLDVFNRTTRTYYVLIDIETWMFASNIFPSVGALCDYIKREYRIDPCSGFNYQGTRYGILDFDAYPLTYDRYLIDILSPRLMAMWDEYQRRFK